MQTDADTVPSRFITIGRVLKPHGVNGVLKVESLTDHPGRFDLLQRVFLGPEDAPTHEFEVVRVQHMNRFVLLSLKGVNSYEEADRQRNGFVQIPENQALPLPEGSFYIFQLIGLSVYTDDGRYVGRVTEIQNFPAQDLFVVHDDDGREILIPDVPAFIRKIDVEEGRITITPIDGLLE